MNGSGSRLGPEVFDHVDSARRRWIDNYACHGEARALYKGERRTMAGRRDKTSRHLHVARERDPDGYVLPTSRELDFLRRIANWIRFCLPWGFETEAWFVRGFLKVFAYSGDVPKREVLRRRSIARHAVADGCSVDQLAALIQLPAVEAEILHDGRCNAPPRPGGRRRRTAILVTVSSTSIAMVGGLPPTRRSTRRTISMAAHWMRSCLSWSYP